MCRSRWRKQIGMIDDHDECSGWMFLLVPAHLGCPGQIPQSRKTVVCVCVCVSDWLILLLLIFSWQWMAFYANGLVCYHRYKKANERQSLDGPMSRLLPRICHICVQLFPDNSELSVFVQKQILKVFFSLIQVLFTHAHTTILWLSGFFRDNPGELVPEETFTHSHLSWWSIIPYLLPSSIIIHGVLPVQFTCLTVFFHNLSPSFL